MAKEKHQCCQTYYKSHWQPDYLCESNAKYERDGKWYCGHHDPVAIAEKNRKRKEAFKAQFQAREDRREQAKRQSEVTSRMFAMAQLVDRALRGVASREEAEAVREEWSSLVADAIECGLITEEK